ncbi:metal ABC transporter permease [Candidatus Spongiihabitans sp.]|uniref:metal ABC transporter permease n=1 Tax=Candidatus Spongiihabitans sp. TaxID=3101308 RepID=UPI003C6F474B
MDEFLVRALVGGIGVAIICGPLGCLVVWQRMSYFGAALSHAALLGIVLGLYFEINLYLSILLICIIVSCLMMLMNRYKDLSSDTAMGILAHASLALGILMLGLMPALRMDLMGYLFGDILSISWLDIVWIYIGGGLVMSILFWIWPPILSLIIQRDLALVDGIDENKIRLAFLVLLSFVVAISMQIVGILLIVSLLIIPAATARRFATSPEQMALFAMLIGTLAVVSGLVISLYWDTPTGPSIVAGASAIFMLATVFGGTRRLKNIP